MRHSPEHQATVFQLWHVNQRKWMKGMPIPHLAKESTGADAFLLSKPTVTIDLNSERH